MEEDKEKFRRMKIFSALDEMREKKEAISAQKLAATVNMGKQTVLPFYKEWTQLEAMTESEKVELSESLQIAIKRELAKEKFALGKKCHELEELLDESNNNIETLKKEYEEKALKQQQAIAALNASISNFQAELTIKDGKIKEQEKITGNLNKDVSSLSKEINTLEKSLQASLKEKESALLEQEKRLDASHQKILEHWLNIVDTERRENESLKKSLDTEKKNNLEKDKKISDFQQKKNHLQSEIKGLQQNLGILEEESRKYNAILNLLGNPPEPDICIREMVGTVSQTKQTIREYEEMKTVVNKLNNKLQQTEASLENQTMMEKEIVRLKGYIEGMSATSDKKK